MGRAGERLTGAQVRHNVVARAERRKPGSDSGIRGPPFEPLHEHMRPVAEHPAFHVLAVALEAADRLNERILALFGHDAPDARDAIGHSLRHMLGKRVRL